MHCRLDRNRVCGQAQQALGQREERPVQGAGRGSVTGVDKPAQLGDLLRHHVGRDGDHPDTADRRQGQGQRVVTTEQRQVCAAGDLAGQIQRSRGLLDRPDIGVGGQTLDQSRRHRHTRAGGYVVQDDRQGAGLCDRHEVPVEALC